MPELLFIYGTLHPDRAPAEIAHAARRLIPVSKGEIRGRRYELGAYPGVVLDEGGDDRVRGEVFLVPDAETLAQLDEYEDFHSELPAASLFLRVRTAVHLQDGSSLSCWIYVYNRQAP
ncbi:Uncharacterized conserved protein YtfP, gamma-glutamylcyclotransferase (GGCT)/AIG2-like family [Granulicella rosea]|uniref:Uncharacterized conserved protein YtfP, gamma-glutamylcyclotransferase (GGCT)/AIG2-like family n=1 Tax=Granulicella rosea TaxID=474952 RepID=A0A239MDS6_9BACT|nr:Uncharacterized conserved protein YtfP, gamma-glutamylcyclotransferase (GGCT)/AIG2-like family [Granulicella rosea]